MRLTKLTRQEVLDYIEEHELGIFLSYTEVYDKDGNFIQPFDDDDNWSEPEVGEDDTLYEYWGVGTETGFSTFTIPMDENKAKYAGVLFHKLVSDHGVFFSDAENLTEAFVHTFKVMQEPPTEEEQKEINQQMVDTVKESKIKIPEPVKEFWPRAKHI